MRTLITISLVLFVIHTSLSQEKPIETKSVLLDDFVSFIAENYSLTYNAEEEEVEGGEEVKSKNITFLIETSKRNPSQEDIISLKQAFRFLSKRLSESDNISIVAYSGMNGLVLAKTTPKSIKTVLNALDDIKAQIDKKCDDGIAYAYEYANKIHDDLAENYVVMVRNPNPNLRSYKSVSSTSNFTEEEPNSKKNGGAIILTAITLLPEIIAVIKD
ncbi:vWA domain-containing protein [Hanstruepera marina]|uniref:hypothetical protein n=1 Tax=Hanstruepera marina TaxID=2873265 RepID=UPI001CA67CEB|nr:hypothetical protein [Hanstruepera marina]